MSEESFTCPRCGMTRHNPDDVREGYCGSCHDWTGNVSAGVHHVFDSDSCTAADGEPGAKT